VIKRSQWAHDHARLMVYIETRAVDHGGELQNSHMRCNPKTHPVFTERHHRDFPLSCGTRYLNEMGHLDRMPDHDDWDCAEELGSEGLIINVGTGIRPVFKFTEEGWAWAHQLRRERADWLPGGER